MEWALIIRELEAAHISQRKIAEFAGCSKSTVSALKSGQNPDTYYRYGSKIVELHRQHCPTSDLLRDAG